MNNSIGRLLLRSVHIDNYKCLSNFNLSLGDLTLLLGKNGCGKSAVFEVVSALHGLICRDAGIRDLFPPHTRTVWNTDSKQSFELRISDDAEEAVYDYRLVVEHDLSGKRERIIAETVNFNGNPLFEFIDGEVQLYHDDHEPSVRFNAQWSKSGLAAIIDPSKNPKLERFHKWMDEIAMLAFNPFSTEGSSAADSRYLKSDGRNFVSWYRGVLQEDPRRMIEIDEKLKNVLPGYEGVRLEKSGEDHRDLKAGFAKHFYAFNQLSTGQRALIVLYMLIFGGNKHALLLDEADNFLMLPEIQPLLAEMKDDAGNEIPQIVLISHHPEAIDFIAPENTVWFEREPGSFARIKRFENDTQLRTSELYARGMVP